MTLATYLVRRGKRGTYQLRVPVPKALQATIGQRERIRSMGTSDPDLAARKAMPILTEWLDDFDRAAGVRVSAPVVDDPLTVAVSRTYAPLLAELEARRRDVPDDDTAYSEHLEKRAGNLRKFARWRQDGNYGVWEADADRIIAKSNLPIERGSEQYAQFVEAIADSSIDALSVFNRRSAGETDAEPRSKTVRRALELEANTAAAGETVIELFEQWGAEALAKGSKRADTVNQDRKVIEQFAAFVGPRRAVESITPLEVADYRDTMRKLPPKWMSNKLLRSLDMRSAATKARELGMPQTTFTNVNKHLSTVSPLYKWMGRQPRWAGLRNPTDGLFYDNVKGKNPRPPFTTDQLNTMLKSPLFTGFKAEGEEHLNGNCRADDWRHWVPLVCLFTGARLGEIAQLRTEDVRKERGVWFIHIRHDESTGQTTKSGKSRAAPIHSKLIELGFLKFHERQTKRAASDGRHEMFPELEKNSRGQISGYVGKWWRGYLQEIGVKAKKGADGFGSHSFRHTMSDLLRSEVELLDDEIEVTLGHNQKTTTSGYGKLPQGTVTRLHGYFEAVRFEGVDFSAVASATTT
jgi:integrase